MSAPRTIVLILVCGAIFAFKQAGAQVRELPLDHLTPGDVRALVDSSVARRLWSAVIAEDVLSQFKSGLMDPVTARAYRHAVLDPGRSRPAGASIAAFLGRPFRLDAWAATLGPK